MTRNRSDISNIMTRLFAVTMLMMFSMGVIAEADADLNGELPLGKLPLGNFPYLCGTELVR